MPRSLAVNPGAVCADLAHGSPLAALRAHASLLRAPRTAAAVLEPLRSVVDSGDRLGRALAIRPLAQLAGAAFDPALHAFARSDDRLLREQAVWALAGRPATASSLEVVLDAIADGGHAAMIAQLTTERWAASDRAIVLAVAAVLERHTDVPARARLVETTTVAHHPGIPPFLARLLGSSDEPESVRAAAARGLATRAAPALLEQLWATGDGGGPALRFACARALLAIGTTRAREAAASLAASATASSEPFDRLLDAFVRGRSTPPSSGRRGLRIAQIFLQGRLDGELSSAGAGDGGGISTLLVQLGRALGSEPEVGRVVTIARALAEPETGWAHTALSEVQSPGVSIERVPFGPAGYLAATAMWEHRLELERALEAAISDLGGVDVAHVRFADAGAFAAARVCARLGIRVAFTAAPDPHAVIQGAEQRGKLTRDTFAEAELREHYTLRAQLVGDLLGQADAVVVLPRPRARAALRELIGMPFERLEQDRVHTIPEGISLRAIDRAGSELARAGRDGALPAVANALLDDVAALPRHRHGLPLLVSVGRFHRVKGLALLLEAWAGDDELHGSLNLVLVGHRPNHEVATVLRIARSGLGSLVSPHGVYACTSQKEEFGVALLEAMATGLSVVAPDAGGPATYVREGLTGSLADTSSVADVRSALRRAMLARDDESRARRTANVVRSRYTIEAMSASLAGVYAEVAREPAQVAA